MQNENDLDPRIVALATYLGFSDDQFNASDEMDVFSISEFNDKIVEYGNEEYLVMTDKEADVALDEELDHLIEDCVIPEIPEEAKSYFDTEKWKNDAAIDGRGQFLAHYDGEENEVTVDGEDYYIYRQ